jgi:Ran GTPase-activating protein (RanGAP) involved in mRNA processing and transport
MQNSKLTNLNIKGNTIRDQGIQHLAELFDIDGASLHNLEELDISSN